VLTLSSVRAGAHRKSTGITTQGGNFAPAVQEKEAAMFLHGLIFKLMNARLTK
jgi:hypothetical protein